MNVTVRLLLFGGMMILASILLIVVVLPWSTVSDLPSDIFRPRTALEEGGRQIYVANGCTYCHTQFVRNIDWDTGSRRVARTGDYIAEQPHLLGSERTGPDLSQEGGQHPDDWHMAHYMNPRSVRPESIMPSFAYLGLRKIDALIAYMQSLGFREADLRAGRQREWKAKEIGSYEAGPEKNVEWLHSMAPQPWRTLPNPYPAEQTDLTRGHRIYQGYCIGCHGPVGDGMGIAEPHLYPPPLNFTILRGRGTTGGILYYQIMNGITGTGMPYFKGELESEKIWDVGSYVAETFIGESDGHAPPRGIDASYLPAERGGK